LPIVVQRTAENILARRGRTTVDVSEPISLNRDIKHKYKRRVEQILAAARRAREYHALIIHADADAPTAEKALNERIGPGVKIVQSAADACHNLVPLVPIRMTEAWMLVDAKALREVIGTRLDANMLGLPAYAYQVESEIDPKRKLREVIDTALSYYPRRRRRLGIGELYEPLARLIRIEKLRKVPAYEQFMVDLTEALIQLEMV